MFDAIIYTQKPRYTVVAGKNNVKTVANIYIGNLGTNTAQNNW